jgi:RimJ/RimL family protein N-acetyltransferase
MTTYTADPGAIMLRDGRRLHVRALESRDRDGLRALFERLSPESRLSRYFSPKPELSARELTFLTDVDQVRHAALAAVDEDDDSIVAVARYVTYAETPDTAEVAVEVADDLQRAGIGTDLMTRIVERATVNGLTVLTARTYYGNGAARALSRRLGFRPFGRAGAETSWRLDLRTSEPAPKEVLISQDPRSFRRAMSAGLA